VRVIGADGEQVGVLTRDQALAMAEEAGLDLVEIVPNADPPVCRVMDFGKFKFEQQKKAHAAKRKTKQQEIKELKFRPSTEDGDYNIKLRNMRRFLEEGDKVKVTVRFKGRQITHPEFGRQQMEKVVQMTSQVGQVEKPPSMEGRMMTMILSPLKSAQQPAKPVPAPRPASPPAPPGQAPPAA